MLILSRKTDEYIQIGEHIRVTVVQVRHDGTVKLGIQAPRDIPVSRGTEKRPHRRGRPEPHTRLPSRAFE